MSESLADQKRTPLPILEAYGNIQLITSIFHWVIALLSAGLMAGTFIVLSVKDTFGAILIAVSILPVLASIVLIRRQKFELTAMCLAFLLISMITVMATKGLGVHHISLFGYPTILIVASLVVRKPLMVIITLYNILCVAWLVFGELSGMFIPTTLVRSVVGDFFSVSIILILTAIMTSLITRSLYQSSIQLKKELGARQLTEEKYRAIFDNAIDGIFQSTTSGRFMSVNPAMARMYGYDSPEDMLTAVTDIATQLYVDPTLRAALRQRLANGEQIKNFETIEYRKDGSTFWTSINIQEIRDAQGVLRFYEGTVEDISPRKDMEIKRQQADDSLRQFKNIMDESNDAIFIIDLLTSRYLYFNGRARAMLGYTHAELSEMAVTDVASHIANLDVWLARVKLVRENNGLIFETSYRRKDGTHFPVEVSARLLEYVDGPAIVAFVRDITERQRAEREREKLISDLEAKNKELEQFTYTVSHDLKAPIITIKGFLGFLEKDISDNKPENVHKDVMRINDAVDKMHRLLSELLELSRIGRMMNASELIPFHELVQTALDNIHGRLEPSNITVQILSPLGTQPNLPAVHGDRQRLTEVLQNLLDNAAKYMGAQPDPRIEIGQQGEENHKPIFYVKDNGIGIAPEYHDRIFGLFNKLDPKSDGTGIGLALVKRIVEVHGGRVWLESDGVPGKGSTFYFTLAGS